MLAAERCVAAAAPATIGGVTATAFIVFLGVSMVVIAVPGQDTALVVRNTLAGGRASGVCTALGVASGLAVWTLAASAGLAALLLASEPAFLALRLTGAVYLVYLGVHALVAAVRGRQARSGRGAGLSRTGAYRRGLVSNLGNPKIAAFFTSLLPQFALRPSFVTLAALGLVFCTLTLGWLAGYAVVVDRLGDLLRRSRARRAIDALTGTVLVAFGLRLATER
jgi:threonine/homoserine/homoserine lactone efflux protein